MTVQLRPYQAKAIEDVRAAIRAGKRRILICAPTGSGKTLTAGAIIIDARAKGSRVLFVAHRKELVDQSVASICRLGVSTIGVIRAGDKRRDLSQPIQVASIQTLARRVPLEQPPHIIFIDECHRALSASYQKALYELYPKAIILGLTATPCRTDGKPLADGFETIVHVATYSELIAGGFIAEPLVYSTPLQPDLSAVRRSGGDFNQDDLAEAMLKGALVGDIGEQWRKHAGGRRTVVFAVDVRHSKAIVEIFKGMGVAAEHLDGTTPEAERVAILARLESGATQVVVNCNVLTEGWDQPSVKCVVLARPTKSLALYMQSAGRGLRPWNDVTPIILDHGGNVDRHRLPHVDRVWSLESKPKTDRDNSKVCKGCYAYIPGGTKVCPHCGYEAPPEDLPEDRPFEQQPIPIDLAIRTLEADAIAEGDKKLRFFRSVHRTARERGWKYGAVIHRFFDRFQEDPPRAWIDALKSDYRGDAEWKKRVSEKQAAKRAAEEAA